MSPSASVGLILAIFGGLLLLIAAVRTMRRATPAPSRWFVLLFCGAMLAISVGLFLRADDLPRGSLWFGVSIAAGVVWTAAAAFYGFVFRRALSRSV